MNCIDESACSFSLHFCTWKYFVCFICIYELSFVSRKQFVSMKHLSSETPAQPAHVILYQRIGLSVYINHECGTVSANWQH